MSYRIFTISPGSTSTKCAVFEDSKLLFKENISHEPEVLKQFPYDYRDFTLLMDFYLANSDVRLRSYDFYKTIN